MDFIEVWNVTKQSIDQNSYAPLLVGFLFIIIESIALYSRKKWGENSPIFIFLNFISHPKYPASKIFIPVGIVALIIGLVIMVGINVEDNRISKELNGPKVQVIEDFVEVEFEQPEGGHTKGDIVHIGDLTFEVSYFHSGRYYHLSIAHGGFLTQGKYVRVYYIPTLEDERWNYLDGKIVKIEEIITKQDNE